MEQDLPSGKRSPGGATGQEKSPGGVMHREKSQANIRKNKSNLELWAVVPAGTG